MRRNLELVLECEQRGGYSETFMDYYLLGMAACYYGPNETKKVPLFSIIDLPNCGGGQVHIHGWDANNLTGGRLYSKDRTTYQPLNSYEVSMLDHYGNNLDLKKKLF